MRWLIVGLLVIALLLIPSCTNQDELQEAWDAGYQEGLTERQLPTQEGLDNAYQDGYDIGYDTGYRDGESFGYSKGRDDALEQCKVAFEDGYYTGYQDALSEIQSLRYVGSINSDVYHLPWCICAEQILPENETWFDSAEEAQDAGYRPCEVCNPP